ncbi:hypothetical protein ABK040_010115 [Willaertia magna]
MDFVSEPPKSKETDKPNELNQYAKQKLNELYLYWNGKSESQEMMYKYIESQYLSNSNDKKMNEDNYIHIPPFSTSATTTNNIQPITTTTIPQFSNNFIPSQSINQTISITTNNILNNQNTNSATSSTTILNRPRSPLLNHHNVKQPSSPTKSGNSFSSLVNNSISSTNSSSLNNTTLSNRHSSGSSKLISSPRSPNSPVLVDELDITVSTIQQKLSIHDHHNYHNDGDFQMSLNQDITSSNVNPFGYFNNNNNNGFTSSMSCNNVNSPPLIGSSLNMLGNSPSPPLINIGTSRESNSSGNGLLSPNSSFNSSSSNNVIQPPRSPLHSPTKPKSFSEFELSPVSITPKKKLIFADIDGLEFNVSDSQVHLKTGILQKKLKELQNAANTYESQKKKMKMSSYESSFSKIPRFYYPNKPPSNEKTREDIMKIKQFFLKNMDGVTIEEFKSLVTDVCQLPYFFTSHLFHKIDVYGLGKVTCEMFEDFWKKDMYFDSEHQKFFNAIRKSENDFILPSDFTDILNELLLTHPGLAFLKTTPEFQRKYAETVIIRIFYSVNRSGNGKISFREFKNSPLLESFKLLEKEQDTNGEINFFAYEHFYVLYCKFLELDTDHDNMLSKEDLMNYGDNSLTEFIIERIMLGHGRKLTAPVHGMMSYEDFVWFCLSEEDKTTPVSQEYWFRCIDVDGDGVLSLYELEQVFAEQKERIKQYDAEISFSDIHCQIIDMLKPKKRDVITLSDIKKSKIGTLGSTNVWAQYAKEEYERMLLDDEEEQQGAVDMIDEEIVDSGDA